MSFYPMNLQHYIWCIIHTVLLLIYHIFHTNACIIDLSNRCLLIYHTTFVSLIWNTCKRCSWNLKLLSNLLFKLINIQPEAMELITYELTCNVSVLIFYKMLYHFIIIYYLQRFEGLNLFFQRVFETPWKRGV
jgi:hypothetical protein